MGEKLAAVAQQLDVSYVSIYRWWQRYQTFGVDGLAQRSA